jgi:hypothetical protein
MMNSTTEGASSNKRGRTSNVHATATTRAASGGSAAAAPSDLASLLGPRLMPLMDLLATQPDELNGTIISLSREMLDLRVTIKQRMKSHARFDKPSTDAAGKIQMDKDGNPLPFVPNSLRSKCPIKSSSQTNNDTEMKALLDAAAAIHTEYISKMIDSAKAVGQLEITLRVKQLRHKFLDLIATISLAWIVIAEVKLGGLPTALNLSRDELSTKLAFDTFVDAGPNVAAAVGVENGAKLAAEFASYKSFTPFTLEEKMSEADSEFLKPIITKMNTWLPRLSVNLWDTDDEKEATREVNAALREVLKTKALQATNDAVEDAMDAEDEGLSKPLNDQIREECKKAFEKQMVSLKRQMRKNYSGDDKKSNQSSKPTKNGRESKESSKAAASKKRANSDTSTKDKKGTSTQQKKKKKKVDNADEPNKPTPKSKKTNRKQKQSGSREGSNEGGKKKGAARR